MSQKHISVMLHKVIETLEIKEDGIYVDLTLGRAGHSSEILKQIPKGQLISFDKDEEAIIEGGKHLDSIGKNYKLIHSDFEKIKEELGQLGIKQVDGITADLGISSPQIDNPERGFSYNKDAKLDMRMDKSQELSAHDIVNKWEQRDIERILYEYADVKLPRRVAKGIVESRPINTTIELVDVIRSSLPAAIVRKKNPAKAVFQAIRIAVNNELDSLKEMLEHSLELLKPGGKLAIITFHSIEDRIVKRFFGQFIIKGSKLPVEQVVLYKVKTYKPSQIEIEQNNRARSAKLRVLTKQ